MLLWLNAVQARQTAHRRQQPERIRRIVPGGGLGQQGEREGRGLQAFLEAPRLVGSPRRLDLGRVLQQVGVDQALGVFLFPAKDLARE